MIPAEILPLIPGCADGRPPRHVHPLPGGRGCNLVLRIDTDAGRFVLRQRQPPLNRPGSAARTELHSQMIAAAAGLAPRLINAAPDGSWLLMDFIDGELWTETELLSIDGLARLGARLATLHSLAPPADVPDFDASAIAAGYLQQLHSTVSGRAERYEPLLARARELSQAIEGLTDRAVLNHGDLQLGNMLGREPLLIDWEYAQVVDPTYDIACLLTYYPRLESQLGLLMEFAGLSKPADLAVLALQRERFALLNQLWDAVNGSKAG
ncbi:MAG: phosphotransferase [Steroidobacteraceae bacterium]